MRITILTYIERDESARDADPVVRQVARALRAHGHDVSVLAVHDDVAQLVRGLRRRSPDLVVNLLEMFGDDLGADIAVAGLLDLLGLRYTGAGPGELYLSQDKALGKRLLAYEQLLYPRFAVFSDDAGLETGGNLRMPLFVKPLRSDASIGIGGDSLVRDTASLLERVAAIRADPGDAALAEEYIEGREFYVGVLGNTEPRALPPVEVDFTGFPEGQPRVLGSDAKWDERSAEYQGTRSVLAELPDELRARIQKVAVEAYRALRVRDYGRVDLRVTDTGDIYVLEVNASCYLAQEGEFAMAAAAAGLPYDALVLEIVRLALERHERAGRGAATAGTSRA